MKFVSKEAQNSNTVAAVLNSTQQPGRVFVTSFRRPDFVQMAFKVMAAFETSFCAKHAPNSEMVAFKVVP